MRSGVSSFWDVPANTLVSQPLTLNLTLTGDEWVGLDDEATANTDTIAIDIGSEGTCTTWFDQDFRRARDKAHPTMKPVALLERALRNSSVSGDVVLDLFGAAEGRE